MSSTPRYKDQGDNIDIKRDTRLDVLSQDLLHSQVIRHERKGQSL